VRKLLVLLSVAACHAGAGPVVAVSPSGRLRLGFEASGGAGPLRGSTGATIGMFGGVTRRYVTLEPGIALPLYDDAQSGTFKKSLWPGAGATYGYSSSETGEHLVTGVWFSTSYTKKCYSGNGAFVGSIAAGVRIVGGIWEIYATPKVGGVAGCFGDNN
jgi:hypothetical protein